MYLIYEAPQQKDILSSSQLIVDSSFCFGKYEIGRNCSLSSTGKKQNFDNNSYGSVLVF